jgi:hypothetical protein
MIQKIKTVIVPLNTLIGNADFLSGSGFQPELANGFEVKSLEQSVVEIKSASGSVQLNAVVTAVLVKH